MKKYFVVSDIHGYYDLLIDALNKVNYSKDNESHILIVCGDVIDRGRQPKEIIDFLLSLPEDRVILIKGNHETLIYNYVNADSPYEHHLTNGTVRTINDLAISLNISTKSYVEKNGMIKEELDKDIVFDSVIKNKIYDDSRLKELISRMVYYYEIDKYVFVHGWIPYDTYSNSYDNNWRNATDEEWEDATWTYSPDVCDDIFVEGKQIVCGHIWSEKFWLLEGLYNNYDIYYNKNFIAIDGKAGKDNPIQVLVIEE